MALDLWTPENGKVWQKRKLGGRKVWDSFVYGDGWPLTFGASKPGSDGQEGKGDLEKVHANLLVGRQDDPGQKVWIWVTAGNGSWGNEYECGPGMRMIPIPVFGLVSVTTHHAKETADKALRVCVMYGTWYHD